MLLNKPVFLRAINIVAYLGTLAVNGLAGSTTLINGVNSGEVSDMYPTMVTPAGFTFAIWGIIYTLLLLFIVYQLLQSNKNSSFVNQIGLLFALSGVLNISWLFLWHYELMIYSLIIMLLLLVDLALIYLRLGIGGDSVSFKEKVFVHVPFSTYFGWISIATIANVSVTLTAIGWQGFGIESSSWALIIICIALLLSLAMLMRKKDLIFCLVVLWAFLGILVNQSAYESIVMASGIGIGLLLFGIIVTIAFSRLRS